MREVPGDIVIHCALNDACRELAEFLDAIVKGVGTCQCFFRHFRIVQFQVELVDGNPQFRRNPFADAAGVFAGGSYARNDAVRIFLVERQKHERVFDGNVGVFFEEFVCVAGNLNYRFPGAFFAGQVQLELEVHVDASRDVLGAFNIAGEPINGICDST